MLFSLPLSLIKIQKLVEGYAVATKNYSLFKIRIFCLYFYCGALIFGEKDFFRYLLLQYLFVYLFTIDLNFILIFKSDLAHSEENEILIILYPRLFNIKKQLFSLVNQN